MGKAEAGSIEVCRKVPVHVLTSVDDLLVRGNRFDACAYAASTVFHINPETGAAAAPAPVMRGVRIVDNDIRRVRPRLLEANSCAGLEFTGNRVDWSDAYPRLGDGPSVVLGDQVPDARIQAID